MPASRAPASMAMGLLVECISLDIRFIRRGPSLYRKPLVISRSGPHGEDKIGGAVSRPHRSFDGGGQSRINPVACEGQIFSTGGRAGPQRALLPRGFETRSALAHDLPGRPISAKPPRASHVSPER